MPGARPLRPASEKLSTLNRRHQRNRIPWFNHIISLDPFGSRGDQKMLVPGLQARSLFKQAVEQIIDGCSFRQFNRVRSSPAAELGKILDLNQHSQVFRTPINGKFRYLS